MFLITHNDQYSADHKGYATPGIKRSAEFGESDLLMDEAEEQPQNVYQIKTGPVVMAPGKGAFSIDATDDFHYLTFVTMIAPSSDIFTITTIDLDQVGTATKFPLFAYDAGTDAHTDFVLLPKHPLKIARPIKQITSKLLYQKNILPFAELNITFMN